MFHFGSFFKFLLKGLYFMCSFLLLLWSSFFHYFFMFLLSFCNLSFNFMDISFNFFQFYFSCFFFFVSFFMNFSGRCKCLLSLFMFFLFSSMNSLSLLNFKCNLLNNFLCFCSFMLDNLECNNCII